MSLSLKFSNLLAKTKKKKVFLSVPRLTLSLASWLSWQDLAKFLLHLDNHGSHGKILIKILDEQHKDYSIKFYTLLIENCNV